MKKLSAEKREQLSKLAQTPDDAIDTSDIPEIQAIPSDAIIGRFYRPKKISVTIRLDADVLAWVKSRGEGYQTRINAYLRELMRREAGREQSRTDSTGVGRDIADAPTEQVRQD